MAEELPWPGELAVIEAYGVMSTSLIQKVGDAAEKAFYALPDYRGTAQRQEYVEIYEQILFGARIEAAKMAYGFHREIARVNGKKFRMPELLKENFFPENLRASRIGDEPFQAPYQERPFREVYKYLNKYPDAMTEAVKQGGYRARILAQTDVQLARRQASLFARRANDNIVGFIRVLTGAESCGLCYVASTQRYRKNNLNPIHPGCDCGELPIYGDTDPGQVIDQYNLDRIHESFQRRFGVDEPAARDLNIGKFVEYKDGVRQADFTLVSIREHGELGPVLTRRNENFLTLEQIQERIKQRERLVTAIDTVVGDGRVPTIGLRSPSAQLISRIRAAETDLKVTELIAEGLDTQVLYRAGYDVDVPDYKIAAERLVELQDLYPTPLDEIEIVTRNDSYAYVYQNRPVMGITQETLSATSKSLRDDWSRNINSNHFGAWLTDTDVDPVSYVITHEYGHLLDQMKRGVPGSGFQPRTIARRLALDGVTTADLIAWGEENVQLFRLFMTGGGDFQNRSDRNHIEKLFVDRFISDNISRYALESRAEFVAEAFSQFVYLGDEATPLAKEVGGKLLSQYREHLNYLGSNPMVNRAVTNAADSVISELSDEALEQAVEGEFPPEADRIVSQAIITAALAGKQKTFTGQAVNLAVSTVVEEVLIERARQELRRRAEAARANVN